MIHLKLVFDPLRDAAVTTKFVGFIHKTGCRWTQAASGAAGVGKRWALACI